jgi:ribosomal protein S18 acetylase RimI-like enzyme
VIRSARATDVEDLVDLWARSGLHVDAACGSEELLRLLDLGTDLVLVDERDGSIVAAVMGTWDGRRGWVQRLATDADWRGKQIATDLLRELESRLVAMGCTKINLLIEPANSEIASFYESFGYSSDELIFMEKWTMPPQ